MMGLRESYQEKAGQQLKEWQAWILRFKSSPSLPRKSRWTDPRQAAEHLDTCYQAAFERLNQLIQADGAGWEPAKEAMEQAMIHLKRALDDSGACQAAQTVRIKTYNHVLEPFERKD